MKKILILDTETTMLDKSKGISKNNQLVYDVGLYVIDLGSGKQIDYMSIIIPEIFNSAYMDSAYYKQKIPKYWNDVMIGTRKFIQWEEARNDILDLIELYDIKYIGAFNTRFDFNALNSTNHFFGIEENYFPSEIKYFDIMKMAKYIYKDSKKYLKFCKENDFITKNGKPRFSAEIVYRYQIKDPTFIEMHMGIEDTHIESSICMALWNRVPFKEKEIILR